jgi:PAS domain S-box-containing protein
MFGWSQLSLQQRVRYLRYTIPPVLVILVVLYQLGVATALEAAYGHTIHYGFEIAFYSLAGPIATWLTLVWVERQLSEKERLEYEINARNQHLASLTNASADAILSLNQAGLIDSWNQGAARLFGYSLAEIIGQPLTRLLPEASLLLERIQRLRVIQNFETTAQTHQGQVVPVDLTHTLLAEDTADNLTSSLILRDITARRERETIIKEERARIARDLHDSAAQVLYLLALKADMAAGQVETDPVQAQAGLQEIGQRSRQVIREIRRTIFALRPLEWSSDGFLPALRRFTRDFADQLNWQLNFQVDDELVIPDRLQPTLFRLVQESFNNAAKHAEAGEVGVELQDNGTQLWLSVWDDGVGFEPNLLSEKGLGLNQMRQRVGRVGGSFNIVSQPGVGTTIAANIPL